MAEFQELTSILKDLLTNRFAPKPNFVRGLLGDGLGNVKVSGKGKEDKSFVRFNRSSTETFEIFNKEVNPVDNWPVLIGELPGQPGLVQVVGTDWAVYEQTSWGESVGGLDKHAPTHEWPEGSPGSDPLNVYLRSIVPLKSFSLGSGSTQVFVSSFNYEYISTGTVWSGVPGIELGQGASTTPATGTQRMMGIYHNPQLNQLFGVTGSTIPFTLALEPPRPAFPAGTNPSAWIRLYGGQNTIAESDIFDARQLFGGYPPTGPAFGDLTGSYPNPQVQGILNFPIEGTLSDNDILQFSGTSWTLGPVALTGLAGGDLTGSYPNPQVQGLLGFPIQGTLSDNDILQFSGSSWSVEPPSGSTGWPFANILTVSTTDPDADHPTIPSAVSAASAGDTILLDSEVFTETSLLVIDKQLTIASWPGKTKITLATSNTSTVSITANGVVLWGIEIENTATGAAAACVATNRDVDLVNCTLTKTGAATAGYGLWIFTNVITANLIDTDVAVSGPTIGHGVRIESGSAVKITNGSYSGNTNDISLNHASATVELIDPVLENGTLTVTAGTATGAYFRASDGLWIALKFVGARVYHSITQAAAVSSAWTFLALDSERYDYDTIHDTVTNNSRLTAKTAGVYDIAGGFSFAVDGTGDRFASIRVNGTNFIAILSMGLPSAAQVAGPVITTHWEMAIGDYVELGAWQSSGGSLNVTRFANYSPWFAMHRRAE